jgi:hypothetical protein
MTCLDFVLRPGTFSLCAFISFTFVLSFLPLAAVLHCPVDLEMWLLMQLCGVSRQQ